MSFASGVGYQVEFWEIKPKKNDNSVTNWDALSDVECAFEYSYKCASNALNHVEIRGLVGEIQVDEVEKNGEIQLNPGFEFISLSGRNRTLIGRLVISSLSQRTRFDGNPSSIGFIAQVSFWPYETFFGYPTRNLLDEFQLLGLIISLQMGSLRPQDCSRNFSFAIP